MIYKINLSAIYKKTDSAILVPKAKHMLLCVQTKNCFL
jgi:hypothetical protein